MKPYYEQDGITIYHGDCREILPQLGPVDHVITDPPYSTFVHSKQWVGAALTRGSARYPRNFHGDGAHKELGFEPLSDGLQAEASRHFGRLAQRWVLVFTDIEGLCGWKSALQEHGDLEYVRSCIWVKPDSAPQFTGDRPGSGAEAIAVAHHQGSKRWNGGGRRGVFTHNVNAFGRSERGHPSPKPLALMAELVSLFTDPGETILDPFMGSGTTLRAAKDLGRKAIGIELEEKWCEVAAKRMSQSVLSLYEGWADNGWMVKSGYVEEK